MAEPVAFSPTPRLPTPVKADVPNPTEKTFDFPEAMRQVAAGKKVHKLEWQDRGYFGFLNGAIMSIHKPDGINYQWVVNDGDLSGKDYIVI